MSHSLSFILLQPFVLFTLSSATPWLEQVDRLSLLSRQCDHFNDLARPFDVDHILVDDEHRFLYCYVPKVACTNWKRLLLVLTHRSNATNVASIPATLAHDDAYHLRLSDLSATRMRHALNSYTLFMVVRHPFERILSAYRNKFEARDQASAKYFHTAFGRHIVRNYRQNATADELRTGQNVTFREFVRYLIAEGVDGAAVNEHWRSAASLCRPCALAYSFLGKYETFAEDVDAVLDLIGAPKLVFPQTRSSRTAVRLRAYFQQLEFEEIYALFRLYERDFRLFGYTPENLLGYDFG